MTNTYGKPTTRSFSRRRPCLCSKMRSASQRLHREFDDGAKEKGGHHADSPAVHVRTRPAPSAAQD